MESTHTESEMGLKKIVCFKLLVFMIDRLKEVLVSGGEKG